MRPNSFPGFITSRTRRFRRDSSGATAVEFALLALPFFLIVFAILETALIFLAGLSLDQSADRLARSVRTGQVAVSNTSRAAFKQELCGNVSFLMNCDRLVLDLKAYNRYAELPNEAPVRDGRLDEAGFGFQRGLPGQIMQLRVYYPWPVYTDLMHKYLSDMQDGSHLLAATVAFKVEPYNAP